MKFSQESDEHSYQITAYEKSSISVAGKKLTRSFILSRMTIEPDWNISDISQLNNELNEKILQLKPELIIIGTGDNLKFPPALCYTNIINQGIAVDFMNTAAACRTYNILAGEARHVVAGFIIEHNN